MDLPPEEEDTVLTLKDCAGYRLQNPISQDSPILPENLDRDQSRGTRNAMQPSQDLGLERKDGIPLRSLRLRSQSM
jgi:hypothetical protein